MSIGFILLLHFTAGHDYVEKCTRSMHILQDIFFTYADIVLSAALSLNFCSF